jgi:hypothetical protein
MAIADELTITGRIYPLEVLKSAVERYTNGYHLVHDSHQIKYLKMVGKSLVARIEILDTPTGRELLSAHDFNFAMYGFGNVDAHNVVSDFEFRGVNVVEPSSHSLTLILCSTLESVEVPDLSLPEPILPEPEVYQTAAFGGETSQNSLLFHKM